MNATCLRHSTDACANSVEMAFVYYKNIQIMAYISLAYMERELGLYLSSKSILPNYIKKEEKKKTIYGSV